MGVTKKEHINMKLFFKVVMLLLLINCNSEDANDCFQTSGAIIQQDFNVSGFERILVNRDIELIIKQGQDTRVTVETGENLLNDVSVEVIGNQLVLTDHNNCNYVRDFGITKVYVEVPDLKEIRCSTQFEIRSDGELEFDTLRLLSENFNFPDSFPVGDFRLQLRTIDLDVVSNNISIFYLSGTVEDLRVDFPSGNGRFEGGNLLAENVSIFHRGSNDMIVNSQQSLTGELRSTGDVIAVNVPPVVDVQELFTGQLIFE